MAEFDSSTMHKCNTCFAAFASLEMVKDHYRTEWHCLNAKRRGQSLTPLSRTQFLQYQAANPKKPIKQVVQPPPTPPKQVQAESPVKTPNTEQPDQTTPEKSKEEEENESDGEETVQKQEKPLPVGANICIFSNKVFENTEDCVTHMTTEFGFFIPDIEYLTDLEGLLTYLGEKVKLGHVCLYCQRTFRSGYAVQNHMASKSHCKISYDNEEDQDELNDFYDFSATYEDMESGEEEEEEMEVTHTGELKLPDGRILGHRQFRRYYKQYYRPADDRVPVLAQQREELLRLGGKFGAQFSLQEVHTMTETDLLTHLIRYQKEIRKGQLVEQRAMKRRERVDQRREYNSTVDRMRSSENTTAKIRDYHRMLV